jgi:poly-gamma-glutamate capsule biosynthesis protein CapA/YwtB (metallophosphatase superfamily)
VTIAATGDIVMGSTPRLPPADGARFFAAVVPALRGGVVLGNLEGTLSSGGASKCGVASTNCYAFQTPPSYARWLKRAHFTVLNLANNHAYDFGSAGLEQTVAALDAQGLRHTGRPGEIAYQRVGPIRVALVGFAPYPWAQDLNDHAAARAVVREADRNADVVVVTMHAGAEGSDRSSTPRSTEYYLGENRGNVRAFAHAVVDAGADLVAGHGPHVLRGMEWYRGRLIAYSLGNFAGYKVFALSGPLAVSGVLHVTLRGNGRFARGALVATRLTADGMPVLDPSGRAHALVRARSRADFGAHAVGVSPTGALR